ncbi:helix-turn-helix transcriptional regulator [Tomitella fengzijianii]|uniref:Helix-turn-helix transcriptional regulator n=1 Tax=Tomitella fengzijianii TaxID=2597660 RepID=A0A516X1Z5_9ACTN|nr:helix-turn-helix transcriptional regulator [Tomitella fengzijianii]QDQ97099.1 helix-turn-helix transcriptional regulator [Tomitella fengzijianii]
MDSAWPLTGRGAEMRRIARTVRGGNGGAVLVGEVGAGKTRLAAEALDRAERDGLRTCRLVASPASRAVPLGVLDQIAGDAGGDPTQRMHRIFDWLARPGAPPAVVGIDDAHDLDEASAFVVQQIVARRVAPVLITVRTGARTPNSITSLWADDRLRRIDVTPLSFEQTRALLEVVLHAPLEAGSARRLHTLTRGNVLYLRQLLDDEVACGRMVKYAGVWVWSGAPTFTPRLYDLIAAKMGRVPDDVADVVDLLAVGGPLPVSALARIATPEAVESAEESGLVAVDGGAHPAARLAHPLFGEVRRAHCGTLRMRRMSGVVARELAAKGRRDARTVVRRAELMLASDGEASPGLLAVAARCAMHLGDFELADRMLAEVEARDAEVDVLLPRIACLVALGRAEEAVAVCERFERSGGAGDRQAVVRTIHASILVWILARPDRARRVLDDARALCRRTGRIAEHHAVSAALLAVLGHPREAAAEAATAMAAPRLARIHAQIAASAQVSALGSLGLGDGAVRAARSLGDARPRTGEAAGLRCSLGVNLAIALRLAGELGAVPEIAGEFFPHDAARPLRGWRFAAETALRGVIRLDAGAVADAVRLLREAVAQTAVSAECTTMHRYCSMLLAEALGRSGAAGDGRVALQRIDAARPAGFVWADSQLSVARAWVFAAEGAATEAVAAARAAAARAADRGQIADQVFCLQAAVQFGDATAAADLAPVAGRVHGPRAAAALSHATALAGSDGDALLSASAAYEAYGDVIAAADAAAQAAVVFRAQGRRGSALTARAVADRVTADCPGADTPALRAMAAPSGLTPRQREIAGLVARGLSNREVADRLHLSVRTVEGHLYRACLAADVDSRDGLAAVLGGAAE